MTGFPWRLSPVDAQTALEGVRLLEGRYRAAGRELPALWEELRDVALRSQADRGGHAVDGDSPGWSDAIVPALLTYAEAGRRLRQSPRTVRRHVAAGRLPKVDLAGSPRIHVDDLDAFVASLRQEAS